MVAVLGPFEALSHYIHTYIYIYSTGTGYGLDDGGV
jgi:hypothetical protein